MSETSNTWSRLEGLFAQALQLPLEERQRFVARECAGEPALRAELQRLLEADAAAADFLAPPTLDFRGQRFLSYEAVEEIGRGGMSVVYAGLRREGDFDKKVAIKILLVDPHRPLETGETQILARLEHPNIARLLDAGATASGFRFLIMEFVDGVPCPAYAATLPLEKRLGLFLDICRAVQFSHQSLIVHRDLKPANILVTRDGVPKLLDFGIAKLLRDDPALTETRGIRAYTPDYASPEQILGEAVTTASDVYSLGVLLCELVCGKPPRQLNTLSNAELVAEVQRDTLPELPFAGDLAAIARKALRRLPGERYPSASELANDVERFLRQEAVSAQDPSWTYGARKFVRRHRWAVAAASLAMVALSASTGIAVNQARVARAEQQRAEEVKDFISEIFRQANAYQDGSPRLPATELLARADQRIDQSFAQRPEVRAELRLLVAESLQSLQDNARAAVIAAKALADAQRTLGPDHPRTLAAASVHLNLRYLKEPNETVYAGYQDLLARMRRVREVDPAYQVHALQYAAGLAMALEKNDEAESLYEEATRLAEKILRPTDAQMLNLLVAKAYFYTRARKPEQALAAAERVHQLTFRELRQDPKHPNALDVRMTYGMALGDAGRWEESIRVLRAAVADAAGALGPEARTLAFYHSHLARYLLQAGELREGAEQYAQAAAMFARDPGAVQPYAATLDNHAAALLAARQNTAVERYQYAFAKRRALGIPVLPASEANAALAEAIRGDLASARASLARLEAGAPPAARRTVLGASAMVWRLAGEAGEALSRAEKALALAPPETRDRAYAEIEWGLVQVELGRAEAAAPVLAKAVEFLDAKYPRVSAPQADALSALARLRLEAKQPASALQMAERAAAFWRQANPESRWAARAEMTLADVLVALGRPAETGYRRAEELFAASRFPGDGERAKAAREAAHKAKLAQSPNPASR